MEFNNKQTYSVYKPKSEKKETQNEKKLPSNN